MEFVDTHCHIHFADYGLDPDEVQTAAAEAGVTRVICVGTTLKDSEAAVNFAADRRGVWASAGIHPHDAKNFVEDSKGQLVELLQRPKVVAIGEIGLDYYRSYSSRPEQETALRAQIKIGLDSGLPFIFHVRDAWEDFWRIFDDYPSLHGVIHSFSAHSSQLEQALKRGLYVALNGIMTFTKDQQQLEAAKKVPISKLLLETDAPFLTPKPYRNEICQPKHVRNVAEFLAGLRGEPLEELAAASTQNALNLFKLDQDG